MGDFPSGQRGQTVNLLSLTSVVRIHHPPPEKSTAFAVLFSMMFACGKWCWLRQWWRLRLMMRGFATFYGKHRIIAERSGATSYLRSKCIISPQAMHHWKRNACALIFLRKCGIIFFIIHLSKRTRGFMSHSKYTKRGKSLYIEKWNPSAKRYINTCVICGAQGYNPSIDDTGFVYDNAQKISDLEHRAIRAELKSVLKPLSIDSFGRCGDCARIMDKSWPFVRFYLDFWPFITFKATKRNFCLPKVLFCLSKPQAWYIISPCGAGYHHGKAVYLITCQRAFSCGLPQPHYGSAKGSRTKRSCSFSLSRFLTFGCHGRRSPTKYFALTSPRRYDIIFTVGKSDRISARKEAFARRKPSKKWKQTQCVFPACWLSRRKK